MTLPPSESSPSSASSDVSTLFVVEGIQNLRFCRASTKAALTRDDLGHRLLGALVPSVSAASPLVVRLLLSDILEELAKSEDSVSPFLARGGRAWSDFVVAAKETIDEARQMLGLSVTKGRDPRVRVVLDAARVLDAKLASLGLVDPAALDEVLTGAVSRAASETLVSTLGAHRILATGVASWSPSQLALWRALDARLSLVGGGAKLELGTFDRPFDAARAIDPLGGLVDAVAEALDDAPATRPIAAVLGDFTFSSPLPTESLGRVEIRKADTSAAGARAVLDAVSSALRGGARPEQIAVVVPEPQGENAAAGWAGSIARLLSEAGIVVHRVVTGESVGGLVAVALDALRVAQEGVGRLALATLLRSRYVDAARLTGLAEDAARGELDRLARMLEMTPTAAATSIEESLAKTVLAYSARHPAQSIATADVMRRVAEPFARVHRGNTSQDHLVNTKLLFEALGLRPRPSDALLDHLAHDQRADAMTMAELEAFARDARGAAHLRSTIEAFGLAFAALAPHRKQSLRAFRIELERELLAAPLPSEARAVGAVRISTLRDLPLCPLSLLVFADVHDGALDGSGDDMSRFDTELRADLTLSLEPSLRRSVALRREADRVRLAMAADGAARIVLTYATRGDDGTLTPPEPFVAWLERQGVPAAIFRDKVLPSLPLTSHEERLARRVRAELASSVDPRAAARAAVEAARESAFGLPLRRPDDRAGATAMRAEVRAIVAEETGGGGRPMSVTSLDRFGACLFQGFAAQVLRARKTESVPEIVDPREEGTLLHAALAAVFGATKELWSARPRDPHRIRALAEKVSEDVLQRAPAASGLRRAALAELQGSVMKVVNWSLYDEEWDFSQAEAGQAVVLDDKTRAVSLRGSADRVDVAHKGGALRVVDYKRSEDAARRLTSALGETSFQLAVYAEAASAALGLPSAAGLYLPTRRLSPSYSPKEAVAAWSRAHAMEDGMPHFAKRALDLITRVRQGDIEPRPANPETCRTCDFDGVCRKPRFVIMNALEDLPEETRDGS